MSSTTTTTVAPPSAEEKTYLASQQALAAKQLELLNSQGDFQKSYLDAIKPILDQQTGILQQGLTQQGDYLKALQPSMDAQTALLKQQLDQQTAAINDPVAKEIQQRSNELLLQQMQSQQDLAPLQKQLLQTQLDQAIQGNNPTAEQIASIDAATKAALASGTSDINAYSDDAYRQLRDNLAPSLGLRPTDTPILDRGSLVAREATRQVGQLTSNLQGANANARLNYPLAAAQVSQATSNSAASISQAAQTFQAQLADAAAANRLNLMQSGNQSFGLGLNGTGAAGAGGLFDSASTSGANLINASRMNPLSFQRGGTSTKSDPWGTVVGLVGGIGSALSGTSMSDARVKDDVKTVGHDSKGRRWVSFKYKGDPKNVVHVGVIAQEVEKTDPRAVLTDGLGLKYVNYERLRG